MLVLSKLDRDARRAIVVVPTTGIEARLYLSGLQAIGAHNAHNAGTAALLALSLDVGLQSDDIQAAIPLLKTPAHRMEIGKLSVKKYLLKCSRKILLAQFNDLFFFPAWSVCKDDRDVLWLNDSKATNVDATLVGLRGLVGKKAVVLLGGLAKVVILPFCIRC